MKKNVEPKFDFRQILERRNWSVARWAESQGFSTQDQVLNWVKQNESQYELSELFLKELFEYIVPLIANNVVEVLKEEFPEKESNPIIINDKPEPVEVVDTNTEQELEPTTVARSNKQKRKVQTEEPSE